MDSPSTASTSKKAKTVTPDEYDQASTSSIVQPEKKKKKKSKKSNDDGLSGEEFKRVHAKMVVSLPPIFVRDPQEGIEEMLDSMILR